MCVLVTVGYCLVRGCSPVVPILVGAWEQKCMHGLCMAVGGYTKVHIRFAVWNPLCRSLCKYFLVSLVHVSGGAWYDKPSFTGGRNDPIQEEISLIPENRPLVCYTVKKTGVLLQTSRCVTGSIILHSSSFHDGFYINKNNSVI